MTAKLFVAAAVAAGLAAFAPAQAGERVFHIDRQSLDYPRGVEATLERVEAFARQACVDGGRAGIWKKRAQAECVASVKADVLAGIGDGRLTRLADNR